MQNEFQNRLKALSGQSFPPFCLGEVLTAITEFDEPIQTSLDLDTLVQPACQREDYHFLGGGGDSEGMDLSSRPPSPLTPLESEEEPPPYTLTVDSYEVDVSSRPPSPLTPLESEEELAGVPGQIERKRKRVAAKNRRSKRRTAQAMSGHPPERYMANPGMVNARTTESKAIDLGMDAANLPSSSGGSWVGKAKKVVKDKPWTMQEAEEAGLTLAVWDGT
jgi:hypothetical protein